MCGQISEVELFLSREYENNINDKMLSYEYKFSKQEVLSYLQSVINVDLGLFVEAILNTVIIQPLNSRDVFQFSNLDNATFALCSAMRSINDPGISYLQAGKLLLRDGRERDVRAYLKYGENHLKTGATLGLFYELDKIYFVSCIGYVSSLIDETSRSRLLDRMILRSRLFIKLMQISKARSFHLRNVLCFLSDSTYRRRRSNIRTLLKCLENNEELDFSQYLRNIII